MFPRLIIIRQPMKRIIVYIAFPFLICIMTVSIMTAYQYYNPPKERATYQIPPHDDTLRIAYIGDSWAYIHRNEHQCRIPNIIEDSCHIPTKIYSYGVPGRTSGEIYEAMFDDKGQKSFIQDFGYSFCIVSAGINDANKKMSINYYRNSMNFIIHFLLSNHIHPIILEIPDYDIIKAYKWQKRNRKLLYQLSMIINQLPLDCKQFYRDAFDELIHNNNYQNKVITIRYLAWNKDYEKDQNTMYLADGIHLNNYGNSILDSIIAEEIITKIKENHD